MQLNHEASTLTVTADAYRLVFLPDRPFTRLVPAGATSGVDLFYLSSVNTFQGEEDTTTLGDWQVERATDGLIALALEAGSSLWKRKVYRFHCLPERLEYEIEVDGQGAVTCIHYLGGYSSASLRWGSGFFWSGHKFTRGFNPEPDSGEEIYFSPSSSVKIDLAGVPLPGRADWFFTPPPFCLAFETNEKWLAMGIQARPGQNQYTCFRYHATNSAFHLSLEFDGHLAVSGSSRLPILGFDFAGNEYEVLGKHANILRSLDLAPEVKKRSIPSWWQGPIFCGWGAQCHLANVQKGRAPDLSRQDCYTSFLATLESHRLLPVIVVIDDKWQKTYGENMVDVEKWPDLPGFIHHCHEKDQKVLLWLKAWDPQGLPAGECICNAAGLPIALDPTQPDCAQRMRSSFHQMLSEDGYGADGFKIDFTARIPNGPGMRSHSSAWGLELMRAYLELVYREAKRIKPDALIIAHTPHPYLADMVDMVRLNDINTGADVVRQMTHRARVARIACPNALIDTDNWPMVDRAAWRAYLPVQPTLGVPALYIDRALDSTGEPLEEEDYAQLRSIWARRSWMEELSSKNWG